MREAEEAEKRHNQANATAIMMIGGFQRSKAVLKSKAGTNQRAGSPGPSSPLPLVSTPGIGGCLLACSPHAVLARHKALPLVGH